MVSAQIPGVVRIYGKGTDGRTILLSSASVYWFGPGGSSDATIANTPEKWNFLPLSPVTCGPGTSLVVTFQPGGAATTDASDGTWQLPVRVNGIDTVVGNAANATGTMTDAFTTDLTPGDDALVANIERPIQILRAKEGIKWQLGGNRVFVSIENNA